MVPLKKTLGALAELVDEGKIGGVALCEVSANTIREAAKITKIAAVEVELSLWSTEPLTNGIAEACFEMAIPIIASVTPHLEALLAFIADNPCSYSPIGRGMFTGQIKSLEDLQQGDVRRVLPRFQPQNFAANMKLVKELEKIALEKDCTPAQLALAWVRSLSKKERMPQIIPIPGARTAERIKENAVEVDLTDEEMKSIDTILGSCEIVGDRYHPEGMTMVNG